MLIRLNLTVQHSTTHPSTRQQPENVNIPSAKSTYLSERFDKMWLITLLLIKLIEPCWRNPAQFRKNVSRLVLITVIIELSASFCLSPSVSLSPALCFDNQTDPNIANHRMDSEEGELDTDNSTTIPTHQKTIFYTRRLDDSFVPSNRSQITSFEPRSNYDTRRQPQYFLPATKRKTTKTRYYIQPSASHHHYDIAKKPSKDPMFIPVAAYSITKHKPKPKKRIGQYYRPIYYPNRQRMPAASSISIRQKRPTNVNNLISSASSSSINTDDENGAEDDETASEEEATDEEYETKKESAVYGYIRKPEVIEFRGQYYYGNGQPIDRFGGQSSEHDPVSKYDTKADYDEQHESMIHDQKHIDHYIPVEYEHYPHDISTATFLLAKLKKVLLIKGITAKGILIATLPLLLVPFLTYLLTPVVIPITANVAAGRRRRKRDLNPISLKFKNFTSILDDENFLMNLASKQVPDNQNLDEDKFLKKINLDEKSATSAVASFVTCEGLLTKGDRCLEQLACEFADIQSFYASHLERAVTAIILGHLLQNEYINDKFQKRLRRAGVYGRLNTRKCKTKYPCSRVSSKQSRLNTFSTYRH